MRFNLTEPNPGDRVSANLVREIVRAIRSLTPVAGSNVKIAQGPNGTVYSTGAKMGRVLTIPGCFDFKPVVGGGFKLINRYYSVGSKVYELSSDSTYEYTDTFVCLKIAATGNTCSASITSFDSISEMRNAAADDDDYYYIPLYLINENGGVACDMRNMPSAAQWEFDS